MPAEDKAVPTSRDSTAPSISCQGISCGPGCTDGGKSAGIGQPHSIPVAALSPPLLGDVGGDRAGSPPAALWDAASEADGAVGRSSPRLSTEQCLKHC